MSNFAQIRARVYCTLDEGAVEPFDVVAVRIEDEHLVAGDRHRKEERSTDGDRQRDRTQTVADFAHGSFILVH